MKVIPHRRLLSCFALIRSPDRIRVKVIPSIAVAIDCADLCADTIAKCATGQGHSPKEAAVLFCADAIARGRYGSRSFPI